MRESVFIIFVVLILLALTAFRYRRQINAVIRVVRLVQDTGRNVREIPTAGRRDPMAAEPLVKCAKCGTWVPENRARRIRSGDFFCSSSCLEGRMGPRS